MTRSKSQAGRSRKRRGRKFSKTRWLYQKDGRDLGPFTPPEVKELLKKGEIGPDTSIRESAHPDWHPVREVRAFVDFIKEIQLEREQAAKERDLDKAEDRVRSVRRAPKMAMVAVVIGVVAAGSWYGWERWKNRKAITASGYTVMLLKTLELTEISEQGYLNTVGGIDWADEKVTFREVADKRTRTRRRGARGTGDTGDPGPMLATSKDLRPGACRVRKVQNLDFGGGGGGGRSLTASDVNSVSRRVTPKLIGCAQREAARNSAFPGTTLCFSIMPGGSLGNLHIGRNGARSGAFKGCVKSALRKVRVAAFDPMASEVARTLTVPLKVGR